MPNPQVIGNQIHRNNIQTTCAEEYYRITLYNELHPHVIVELLERFIEKSIHGIGLLHLLPSQCCSYDLEATIPDDLVRPVNFYKHDLPHAVMIPSEYQMLVSKWKLHVHGVPKMLVDVLQACDQTSISNIRVLLQLPLTIPITYYESERSFSRLRLIKTY